MLHHIQKNILNVLASAESARYSDLKPYDMDGNTFTYHLKQLMVDKYIVKQQDGSYALLPAGKNYIIHRHENPLSQAHSIFLIVVRRGDEWLVRERRVQPLLGMTGFVHGEPVANEPVAVTARHRLFEKTGIDTPLRIYSSGLICITAGDEIASFSHALILVGDTTQDVSVVDDQTGHNFWISTKDLNGPDMLPSCLDLVNRIVSNDVSPYELEYQL